MDPEEHLQELRLVHSSDLHLRDTTAGGNVNVLQAVLDTTRQLKAHVLLLVGDVFDHNRVSQMLVEEVLDVLSVAEIPVVILPGNHDSLGEGSVYSRGGFAALRQVHVIGTDGEPRVLLPEYELEIWGRAHVGHDDICPIDDSIRRTTRRRVVAAHGHWVKHEGDLRRSYLIHKEQVVSSDADYVALGHWDHWVDLGIDNPPTYYSGAPAFARSVNFVRLLGRGGAEVSREEISTLPTRNLHL